MVVHDVVAGLVGELGLVAGAPGRRPHFGHERRGALLEFCSFGTVTPVFPIMSSRTAFRGVPGGWCVAR